MHHIVYQSQAVGIPTTADLRFLLRQSRANNSGLGITGLLLYGNGSFLQVLEGEAQIVRELYAKFATWSMGFQSLSGEDFVRLTGYIDPYRSKFLDAHLPEIDDAMLILLKSFVVNQGVQL
jgi:hypothetical protein